MSGGWSSVPNGVAIRDPLPSFRLGLAQALDDGGFPLIELPERDGGIPAEVGLLLLSIRSSADWALLSRLCKRRLELQVVALLDAPSATNYRTALRLGATSAMPRDVEPSSVVTVVRALTAGEALVPAAVALAVIDATDGHGNGNVPSDQEIRWLRCLAEGMPVARLALEEGYSVRSMYRRLAQAYRRLGAPNRMQALVRAAEAGWLTTSS
jgi:DNA-binding NarL/FixJ family response regulator